MIASTGNDDDSVGDTTGFMNAIYNRAFMVRQEMRLD